MEFMDYFRIIKNSLTVRLQLGFPTSPRAREPEEGGPGVKIGRPKLAEKPAIRYALLIKGLRANNSKRLSTFLFIDLGADFSAFAL